MNYITEYKQGRKKNFYLRNNGDFYMLDKITKSVGYSLVAGSQEKVMKYIEENGFTEVQLIAVPF